MSSQSGLSRASSALDKPPPNAPLCSESELVVAHPTTPCQTGILCTLFCHAKSMLSQAGGHEFELRVAFKLLGHPASFFRPSTAVRFAVMSVIRCAAPYYTRPDRGTCTHFLLFTRKLTRSRSINQIFSENTSFRCRYESFLSDSAIRVLRRIHRQPTAVHDVPNGEVGEANSPPIL
ncbi:hypothetical protein BC827DRAFT_391395 [Russula dissimulans]|nr:hypothetical protein BC827DRAFT_391395 [Russula dissimulans]